MNTNGKINWQTSAAGQQMMETFSEERTLNAIEKLLHKVDTLEKAVDNLTTMMNQAPGLVAMVGDMVDEGYRNADARGVKVEERLKNALDIAEKLTAPDMIEKLDGLLGFANQAPGITAMVGDMVDEGYRNADARGVNIDQRLGAALMLAEKLTEPAMVENLNTVIQLAIQAPGMIAMTMDMVDEGMKNAIANGLEPQTLGDTFGTMGIALTQAKQEPPTKVGLFGLFGALRDEDRQMALGFLMNFLKQLGKRL